MKYRCTDNLDGRLALIVGKVYEGRTDNSETMVQVVDEAGVKMFYSLLRFEEVVEQSIIEILHPYTILVWSRDRGFQPIKGLAFKTAEAVFDYVYGSESPDIAYIHTPSGCLYTPKAIVTLGLNLWKEINREDVQAQSA